MDKLKDFRQPSTTARSVRPLTRVTRVTGLSRASAEAHWTDRFAKNAKSITRRQSRWFASLMGVAALAIIAQAAIAGEFNAHPGNSGWILAHGLISYVTLASTLAATGFTIMTFRSTQRALTALTTGLFVLAAAQTVIGYLITVGGLSILLVVHIPLAFIIFGLAGWLSLKATAITGATHRRFRG